MSDWLQPELQRALRPVAAPPELWERLQTSQTAPAARGNRGLVWAMAAALVLSTVGLSVLYRENVAFQATAADHCQNPAQLRAWVRAKTGLDLPFRANRAPSVQLIDAQMIEGTHGVKIVYRAGNRDGVLLVSTAVASANIPHSHFGQRFAVSADNPADLQLACKLCHLD